MTKASFDRLYVILLPLLIAEFLPSGGGGGSWASTMYIICTKIHLSIALHYFAGASVYDIMISHGASLQSVYNSVGRGC